MTCYVATIVSFSMHILWQVLLERIKTHTSIIYFKDLCLPKKLTPTLGLKPPICYSKTQMEQNNNNHGREVPFHHTL